VADDATECTPIHDQSLVSPRRFGSALVAARTVDGLSLSAMSRRCDGWWRPDELAAFELGARPLDDAEVLAVARLYHLKGAPLPSGDAFGLLLDRSTAPDIDTGAGRRPEREPAAAVERLLAFGSLLGADVFGTGCLGVLADAFGTTTADIEDCVRATEPARVEAAAEVLATRAVVPLIGVLLSYTAGGSVMLGRPAGRRGRRTHRLPGAAPLRSLIHRTAAAH
jgi:hypothetical protein